MHTFEGLCVNDCGSIDIEQDRPFIRPGYLDILLDSDENIIRISKHCYFKINDTKKLDKLIAVSKAADILSGSLAPHLKYDVTEAELKYVCETTQGETELIYSPRWCFTLRSYSGNDTEYFPRLTAFVDAVSGEIMLCDSYEHWCDSPEGKGLS